MLNVGRMKLSRGWGRTPAMKGDGKKSQGPHWRLNWNPSSGHLQVLEWTGPCPQTS